MKNPFLVGKKIYLRVLEDEDLNNLLRWINDSKVTYYLQQGDRPPTINLLKKMYDVEGNDKQQISFAIIDRKTNKHVGWTGLYAISWTSRYAEMRIFIGEKSYWKKGIATEAQKLLVEYGFEKLNLHRIFAGTNIELKGEQKALRKLFFREEGISKEAMFRNGKYYDVIYFGILKKDYQKKVKEKKW